MVMQDESHGKRTDENGCKLHDKPMEIPEKYPQDSFSGKQSLRIEDEELVKLLLKNCMNISSEGEAEKSAFIF